MPLDVEVKPTTLPGVAALLTPEALDFLGTLHRQFDARRRALLSRREEVQARLDAGESLGFLPETDEVRKERWAVAPMVPALTDRRVEITGPTDRKMIIN